MIVRNKKSTCISSAWQDLVSMISQSVDKSFYSINKTEHIVFFGNGSEIWTGGLDDSAQVDKILGTEWATIYMNEASDTRYTYFEKLKTRLNINPDKTDIKRKFFIDENPPSPAHWTYKLFIECIDPLSSEKLLDKEKAKNTHLHFTPLDNKDNLSSDYLDDLKSLRGMAYKRFYEGVFAYNCVGQVYHTFNRDVNVDNDTKYAINAESWRSWDFGVRDSVAIIWYQILHVPTTPDNKLGLIINIFDEYIDNEKSAEYYANYVKSKYSSETFRDAGDPAGIARNASLESWISILRKHGINVNYKTGYSVADMVSHANTIIPYIRINEEKCPKTCEMFGNWTYELDKDGNVPSGAKPKHDDYSHLGTSFYYFCINAINIAKKETIIKII